MVDTPGPADIVSSTPPMDSTGIVAGNTGLEWGAALAAQFVPDDATTQGLFATIQDLSPLEVTTTPPPGRDAFTNDEELFRLMSDVGFQMEAEKLVDQGVIGPRTFVLADTGHNIPVLATLMERLDMSGSIRSQGGVFKDPSREPFANQAQTWGNDIDRLDTRNSADGHVSSYFLGLDVHRYQALTLRALAGGLVPEIRPEDSDDADFNKAVVHAEALPTAGQLRDAGVDKVVVLIETAPGRYNLDDGNALQPLGDVRPYLRQLRADGLGVDVRGIDWRELSPLDPNAGGTRQSLTTPRASAEGK